MSDAVNAAVRGALKTIFDGRFFAGTFKQKDGGLPQWPAGRYLTITGVNEADIYGSDSEDTDDTIIQIDVVAKTAKEREEKTNQVIAAMQNLRPPAVRTGLSETFDEPTRTYRKVLEYTFYASSGVPL